MISATRLLITLCATLWLAGCGSSPPVRYFALQSTSDRYQQESGEAAVLSLGPLRLPDYLDRSQLVTRGAGAEILVDGQSRWAEPLDQAIHRVVARTVDALVADLAVVAYPTTSMVHEDYRLVGKIDRFEADAGGLAVLEIQWGIGDRDANPLVSTRRSRYSKQAMRSGDPGAIVEALSDTLAQYSRDIAKEINEALALTDGE